MKRANVRTLSLVVTTFTYLLIGAAVFDSLESLNEEKTKQALNEIRDDLVRKYKITPEDYNWIEQMVIENVPHKAGPQWKFSGSFYFSTVVLAMIGYGHSTPNTWGGKAFCMLYAAIGIPLGIVMFQSIGERLNKGAGMVISRIKRCLKFKKPEATEINLMTLNGLLSTIIMTTGAAVFSKYEGWSYFDAFYYCFITLTTIGSGDYVALQNDHALQRAPGYMALTIVFILFGLAVVASSINILVLRFMTMQMEEIKREDTDLGACTQNVVTYDDDGEEIRMDEDEDDEIIRKSKQAHQARAQKIQGQANGGGDPKGNLPPPPPPNLYGSQVSVCSCTCYPRVTDLHHLYSSGREKKRKKWSEIFKRGGGEKDVFGTEEELYSLDDVPAIIEDKRASV